MKHIKLLILSILTLGAGFSVYADEIETVEVAAEVESIELKTEAELVAEYGDLLAGVSKDATDMQKKRAKATFFDSNEGAIFTAYKAFTALSVEELADQEIASGYAKLRDGIYTFLIKRDSKKFIKETAGVKEPRALYFPLGLVKEEKFAKAWTAANMESIALLWADYAQEYGEITRQLTQKFLDAYVNKNPSVLKDAPFAVALKFKKPIAWLSFNEINYETLKADGFEVEGVKLAKPIVFQLAKEAKDYDYIVTLNPNGIGDDNLTFYTNYMISQALTLSDGEAYAELHALSLKLIAVGSKTSKKLAVKTKDLADNTFLGKMRSSKVK